MKRKITSKECNNNYVFCSQQKRQDKVHQRGRWRIIFIVKEKRKSHRTILKIFHLTIPLKIYYHDGGLQYDQSDENRSSGYSMVKVPLYLSADKVDKDNDDGHRKYFDINLAVY